MNLLIFFSNEQFQLEPAFLHSFKHANAYNLETNKYWMQSCFPSTSLISIIHPLLRMEGKSSTQRVRFYVYLPIKNFLMFGGSEFEKFYYKTIASWP